MLTAKKLVQDSKIDRRKRVLPKHKAVQRMKVFLGFTGIKVSLQAFVMSHFHLKVVKY